MLDYMRSIANRRRDAETGASAVEYGLLVALIAAIIVLAVYALGSLVNDSFQDTCGDIAANSGSTSDEAAACVSD
ncbi:MAG: Flp family type IVb pilin [Nocardioidaceae bacterium]|nr:Flp family type IVb pilin [Nocardioidaceae bacterium]